MEENSVTTNFHAASKEVLQYLHSQYGFGLWMVTRTKGLDWIVLEAEDHGYSVKPGDVFNWADSFCSRMVRGEGPCIAPKSDEVTVYKEAPIGAQVQIGAYVGLPLRNVDGELFGTLCAIDPEPQPDELVNELPQIKLFSRLLETILVCEYRLNDEARRADRAEAKAMSDHLTGLFNRRGWNQLLTNEEARCQKYAHPATVLSIDLDELKATNDSQGHQAGDALLKKAASLLKDNVRRRDIVARVGGDEFLILAVECKECGASSLAERIQEILSSNGVAASVGFGLRKAKGTLQEASLAADEAMYVNKRERKLATAS